MEEGSPEHPLAHIEPLKRYEWMLSERASLEACRQARQDGLVATIIQISSAALLAIPGLFLAKDSVLPAASDSPLIYIGIGLFGLALIASMLEQHLSVVANEKHIEIVQNYYIGNSSEVEDSATRSRVAWARKTAYSAFVLAMASSSAGLMAI